MTVKKIEKPGKLLDSESSHFRSGFVELKKGESIGEHSTRAGEEIIVVLEGNAHVECNGNKWEAEAHSLVLIPPNSRHNVTNKSEAPLRYVYIISKNQ